MLQITSVNCSVMIIDCVAYLMTYELHVLEVYVYSASNAVLYCMDSTLRRLRAVCTATARLLFSMCDKQITDLSATL